MTEDSFRIELDDEARNHIATERQPRNIAMAALKVRDNQRKPYPEDESLLLQAFWAECDVLRERLIEKSKPATG